jgi:magnesium transporter
VNIELSQARETANIYSNLLDSTMDTYQSIINNNMNTIMRTLTSVTIILMLPTLVASFFGMNLVNGMEENPVGFIIAIVISVLISIASWFIFRHKRLI